MTQMVEVLQAASILTWVEVEKKYKLIKRRMSSAKTCDLWLK